MNCSACDLPGEISVMDFILCHHHGHGMMVAVLCGDSTPVGYIMQAACEEVSDQKPTTIPARVLVHQPTGSPFMRHGALAEAEPINAGTSRSSKPAPIRAQVFS